MNFINTYINYINRIPSNDLQPTGIDILPDITIDTGIWTGIFSILFLLVPIISKYINKQWYDKLEKRKRNELPSYIVCLFHHFNMVPRAWFHVIADFLQSNDVIINYAEKEAVVAPFCLGYLLSDTLFYAIPEALLGKFEYIIHHILTIYLVISTLVAHGSITKFIPHLLICDTTNIFFNTAWLLRLTGFRGSIVVTYLELTFAIAFLFTRVINLPVVFYSLYYHPHTSTLGYAKYTLPPIAFLQWFWFYKIVRSIVIRLLPAKKQRKEE